MTKQIYEWFSLSVRLSVPPFSLCTLHCIIMKFSRFIIIDKSDVHATQVRIHGWIWNDAQSLKWCRTGVLFFLFKVICKISRSHRPKYRQFWLELKVSGLYLQFEFTDGYKMMHKAWRGIEEVPCCVLRSSVKFQGHMGRKMTVLALIWAFLHNYSKLWMAIKWHM